jgi:glutaryl-CoA dehydrogenase
MYHSDVPENHVATPETARAKPARLIREDPFLLDTLLTEEEHLIRDTAQACCQDKAFL